VNSRLRWATKVSVADCDRSPKADASAAPDVRSFMDGTYLFTLKCFPT
jgi:hypothetical protein